MDIEQEKTTTTSSKSENSIEDLTLEQQRDQKRKLRNKKKKQRRKQSRKIVQQGEGNVDEEEGEEEGEGEGEEFDIDGADFAGNPLPSLKQFWSENQEKDKWYSHSASYWTNVEGSVSGMLGGFPDISSTDIKGSVNFLKQFYPSNVKKNTALDCGAGIGRVSSGVLLPLFQKVDIVEQEQKFIDISKENFKNNPHFNRAFCSGLQDFSPEEGYYDLIWIQWVIIYLTDDDLVNFFIRCKNGLQTTGKIILKDNVCSSNSFLIDTEDKSITRSVEHLRILFKKSGLKIIKEQKQRGFPQGLFPVIMFALVPDSH